mgnify:CR=1 FL=1
MDKYKNLKNTLFRMAYFERKEWERRRGDGSPKYLVEFHEARFGMLLSVIEVSSLINEYNAWAAQEEVKETTS